MAQSVQLLLEAIPVYDLCVWVGIGGIPSCAAAD